MKPGNIQSHIVSIQQDMENHPPLSDADIKDLEKRVQSVRKEVEEYRQETPNDNALNRIVKKLEQNVEKLARNVSALKDFIQEIQSNASSSDISSEGYHPGQEELATLLEDHDAISMDKKGLQAVMASRGLHLDAAPDSANPVAMLSLEYHIPLDTFRKTIDESTVESLATSANTTPPTPLCMAHMTHLIDEFPGNSLFFSMLAGEYLEEIINKGINIKTATFDQEGFEKSINFHIEARKEQTDSPAKIAALEAARVIFIHHIRSHAPGTTAKQAQNILNLIKGKKTEVEEKFVRFDLREIREMLLTFLKIELSNEYSGEELEKHMTAMHFFLSRPEVHYGDFLSPKETEHFLREIQEGIKTTYNLELDTNPLLKKATKSINVTNLYLMTKKLPILTKALESLPDFHPEIKGAVAKGGPETARETTIIALAASFGFKGAVLEKEVFESTDLVVQGKEIKKSAVIAPYIPGIADTPYHQTIKDVFRAHKAMNNKEVNEHLERLRTLVTPESYGESLFLSLLLLSTDDHFEQFTVLDNRLINYDMGRDLPPGRFILEEGNPQIMLRCALMDFPQFADKLPNSVLEKIKQITPDKIEEKMKERRLSSFKDPFKARKILEDLKNNPPKTPAQQQQVLDALSAVGNRPTMLRVETYFKNGSKKISIINELIKIAERGCKNDRNRAIKKLELHRDFHDNNQLENPVFLEHLQQLCKMSGLPYEKAISYVKEFHIKQITSELKKHIRTIGADTVLAISEAIKKQHTLKEHLDACEIDYDTAFVSIPHFDESQKAQIDDQIDKIIKASVDENMIETMKEGQKNLIKRIKKQGSITGQELAETLYPEEMLFYQTRKEIDVALPSLFGGWGHGGISKLMAILEINPDLISKKKFEALQAAKDKILREAYDLSSYWRYCS